MRRELRQHFVHDAALERLHVQAGPPGGEGGKAALERPQGLRGGGGNFGVVTSFLFRLHEVGTVIGGPTFWPAELGAEVLSAYREFLPTAPRELNGFFAFTVVPPE